MKCMNQTIKLILKLFFINVMLKRVMEMFIILTGNQCMFFPARKYPAALPLFGRKVDCKEIKFRDVFL